MSSTGGLQGQKGVVNERVFPRRAGPMLCGVNFSVVVSLVLFLFFVFFFFVVIFVES